MDCKHWFFFLFFCLFVFFPQILFHLRLLDKEEKKIMSNMSCDSGVHLMKIINTIFWLFECPGLSKLLALLFFGHHICGRYQTFHDCTVYWFFQLRSQLCQTVSTEILSSYPITLTRPQIRHHFWLIRIIESLSVMISVKSDGLLADGVSEHIKNRYVANFVHTLNVINVKLCWRQNVLSFIYSYHYQDFHHIPRLRQHWWWLISHRRDCWEGC